MLTTGVTVYIRAKPRLTPRDRSLLVDAVAHELGCSAEDIVVSATCPRCHSIDHGMPTVSRLTPTAPPGPTARSTPGSPAGPVPLVSLSRSDDLVVVALVKSGLIGIDIERVDRFFTDAFDDVLLHAAERSTVALLPENERPFHRATLWAAKESILKATGHGLAIDPELLSCIVTDGEIKLVGWPETLALAVVPRVVVHKITEDRVCAIAWSARGPITFSWWPDSSPVSS